MSGSAGQRQEYVLRREMPGCGAGSWYMRAGSGLGWDTFGECLAPLGSGREFPGGALNFNGKIRGGHENV